MSQARKGCVLIVPFTRARSTIILALALGGGARGTATGQALQFRQLTPNDGLASSQVQVLLQDTLGFMWLGTTKGLDRYDGTSFTVYRHRDTDAGSIAISSVDAACEDSAKTLWFGTTAGLSRYDRGRDAFDNYVIVPGDSVAVAAIAEAHGILWLGTTRGLYQFDRGRRRATPYRPDLLAKLEITSILVDRFGHLWIGSRNDGLREVDPRDGSVRSWTAGKSGLPGSNVNAVIDDGHGGLWIGLLDAGLVRLDRATGALSRYLHDAHDTNSLAIDRVHALMLDGARGLWVGTENGGLDYLDFAIGGFEHNSVDARNPSSLSSNSIWSLTRDATGLVWVGTFAGGVNVSRYNGDAIRRFRTMAGDASSLSFNSVMAFQEDARGAMWIATDGGGLNRFDPITGRFTRYSTKTSNLNSDAVLTLTERQGALWLGTWGGGISRFDDRTRRFTAYTTKNSGLAQDEVFSIHADHAGQLWIGTYTKGLQRLDPATGTFTSYKVAEGQGSHIRTIVEASDGTLLLGTVLRGLAAFDPKTGQSRWYRAGADGINSNQVQAILEAEPGVTWVGTASGLNRLDRRSGKIERFGEADGLPAGGVSGIEMDAAHDLWLSGDRGITRFNPGTKKGTVYTVVDGLQGNEFNGGAYFRSRDGLLYFGGTTGFNIIDPSRIAGNTHVPPVVLTGFKLFDKPVAIGAKDAPLAENITVAKHLTLRYDQSAFTIDFAALDYASPNKNQYAYRLEGLGDDWHFVENQHSASYNNVPAGDYVFLVRASNNDGVWNDVGASVDITITPPFWATWWFRMLVVASIVAIVGAISRRAQQRNRALRAMNDQLGRASEHDRKSQQYLEGNVIDILGAMQQFSAGDYSVALQVQGDDPIGRLRRGFNSVVADRKRAEEELRQSQKMEAVGQLAGGVAHDFNNLLTVIKGNTELALDDLDSREAVREELEEIGRAADRASSLTRQLLAFSRKQILSPRTFSLNDMVRDVGRLLSRTVGEDIDLRIVLEPALGAVRADPGLIEQVLLNLVVNARDAMPRGGTLTIDTTNVAATSLQDVAESEDIPYVAIRVTDTGTGMAQSVMDRIFEPFFTTKAQGKGTGLGLSTVYGSVKQSGGFVRVASVVGRGSSFTVFIPRAEQARDERVGEAESGAGGTATILLVEDEDAVRRLAKRVLTRAGYTVLDAAHGDAALAVASRYAGVIHLLLTDVVMPGMSGRELAEQLVPLRPGILLLYASGYTQDAVIRHGVSSNEMAFIQKPFTPMALLCKVRQVLDGTSDAREADAFVAAAR